jgi:hypothetical protein
MAYGHFLWRYEVVQKGEIIEDQGRAENHPWACLAPLGAYCMFLFPILESHQYLAAIYNSSFWRVRKEASPK